MSSDTLPNSHAASLRPKWGWIVAVGVVYIIASFVALGSVLMATVGACWAP